MPLDTDVECCNGCLENTKGDLTAVGAVAPVAVSAAVAGGGGGANCGGGGGVKPSVVGEAGTAEEEEAAAAEVAATVEEVALLIATGAVLGTAAEVFAVLLAFKAPTPDDDGTAEALAPAA